MKIKEWISPDSQFCWIGTDGWSVPRLFELARNLSVIEMPLDHLCIGQVYNDLTIKDMVMHFRAVEDADLTHPIILSEHGEIMDGRHRVMKALMLNHSTIKAVRFEENPEPCRFDK
jgi:hypothetical protein